MAITTVSSHVVSVNAIQGTLIADNAITAVHIATNAVSGTLIADNAITAVHVAQNSITVTQLADDCVESDKIADGVITTNHLNKAMISSQTEVTPVAGDFVLLGDTSDSNNLKKAPLTLLLNSNVDLSTKLNLSGGTMSGTLKTPNLTINDGVQEFDKPSVKGFRFLHNDAGNDLSIQQGDTNNANYVTKLNISTDGNVGIGTNSPNQLLHLNNSTSSSDSASIRIISGSAGLARIMFGDTGYGSRGRIVYDNSDDSLQLWGADSTTSAERMRIDSSGDINLVKAGTAQANLNFTTDGSLDYARITGGKSGSGVGDLRFFTYAGGIAERMRIDSSGNLIMTTGGTIRAGGANDLILDAGESGTPDIYLLSGGSTKVKIEGSNGNVGIGTTSPAYKLHQSGTGLQRFQIDSTDNNANGSGIYLKVLNSGSVVSQSTVTIDNAGNLKFFTGTSSEAERMRIDSGGTLFLGTTSPTLHSAVTGIVFENGSLLTDVTRGAGKSMTLAQNAAVDSGNTWAYLATDEASYYQQFNGNHYFATAPSGSAGADVTMSTKMMIHNSGCIDLGAGADRSLGTNITTTVTSGSAGSGFWLSTGNSSATSAKIYTIPNSSVGDLYINQGSGVGGGAIYLQVNEDTKVRIASNGNVSMGTGYMAGVRLYVDAPSSYHAAVFRNDSGQYAPIISDNQAGSGTRYFMSFRLDNTEVGKITSTGSTTLYGTSSDYRLKENVTDMTNATTRLKELKPKRFNWIADETNTLVDGFLAHEVSSIVPEAVDGEKDGEIDENGNGYQGIDQSKLVPLLVKTIQELEARIATLEG